MAICDYCNKEMTDHVGCTLSEYSDMGKKPYKRIPSDKNCGDCGCPKGTYHHPGCDVEKCPKCNGQAISCNCVVDDDE